MEDKPKGSVGIEIGPNVKNVSFKDVRVSGADIPIRIAKGSDARFENVTVTKNSPSQDHRASSAGYSGVEQFDPKREARKDDLFYGPRLLLNEGAYKHLVEFDNLSISFFAAKPYACVAEIDAEAGYLVHKIRVTAEPPNAMCYAAYAVVNDLRNALDQALSASCEALNGRECRNVYFPFGENPRDLAGMLASDRYSDIPDTLKPYLTSLQPYPTSDAYEGGDDLLRAFAKIANPNKHQIPLGLNARNIDGVYTVTNVKLTKLIDIFDPHWDSAKNEIVIAKTDLDGSCDYTFGAPFYIAFADAGFLFGYPVSATLSKVMTKVDSIVLGLEAETKRLVNNHSG